MPIRAMLVDISSTHIDARHNSLILTRLSPSDPFRSSPDTRHDGHGPVIPGSDVASAIILAGSTVLSGRGKPSA
jgi:hypothetical protein